MEERAARRLRDLLAALLLAERLSVGQLMRLGGLSRNSITYILDQVTHQPERRTIERLARGLATDPGTGVLERPKMEHYEALLNAAAGYGDLTAEQSRTGLELMLYYQLQSLPLARRWASAIERLRGLDEDEVDRLGADAAEHPTG
jgi:hypothetical protein